VPTSSSSSAMKPSTDTTLFKITVPTRSPSASQGLRLILSTRSCVVL